MGYIRCSHCNGRRETKGNCPHCGNTHCHIVVWWRRKGQEKGKEWKLRRFPDGFMMDFERASAMLGEIRLKILAKKFDPQEYTEGKLTERQFDNKADRWLKVRKAEMERDIIRPSSYCNMEGHMMNHIIPFFAHYDVKDIAKEDLANFRDNLPPQIKSKTRRNIFQTLHAFFTWLFHDLGIPVPPFPPLESVDDAEERQALDIDEQLKLLRLIPVGIERDMLEMGMELGIRPGELVALKVKDFDLLHKRARIARTVSQYTYILEGTKGRPGSKGRKKGEIPLSDRAMVLAEKYIKNRFGEEWLFICKATNNRYSVKAPNRLWKKYTKSELVYYEASRHSFLTQLSDAGVDVLDLKDLARHSDIRTTQKYIHKRTEHLREKTNLRRNIIEIKKTEESEE
jgi:integrase